MLTRYGFNPCFNGSMYKNKKIPRIRFSTVSVSILVLMDLCIKTVQIPTFDNLYICFNPCFNGSMYKNKDRSC